MKYAWIKKHSNDFNITIMCRVLQVDRSSYYHWIKNGCIVKKIDTQLNDLIKTIFIKSRATYGARRIKSKLEQLYGLIVSRRRICKYEFRFATW